MRSSSRLRTETSWTQVILEHVARNGISLQPTIARLPAISALSSRRLRRLLQGLMKHGLLGSGWLYANRRYYFLTPAGARLCGAAVTSRADDCCGPLSERAKIFNYAMLTLCCLGSTARQRLTREELRQHFGGLYRPGVGMNYYVDRSGDQPRLGFVRVDVGGYGRWDRVVSKCRDDWLSHQLQPGFRQLIDRRQFEITIVTAMPQKAGRIRDALTADRNPMLVRVCAIPELINLIAPPPR